MTQQWMVEEEMKTIHKTRGAIQKRPRIGKNGKISSLPYVPRGATGSK